MWQLAGEAMPFAAYLLFHLGPVRTSTLRDFSLAACCGAESAALLSGARRGRNGGD
jgi:hypothetical protein